MFTLNCKGQLLVIDEPIIMGIINTTPDSFYKSSRINERDAVLVKAGEMIRDGASILDVGGQSTRPNSKRIGATEEMDRVLPAVESLRKNFPGQLISIDTFYALVAKEAVRAGASIVNDVSAGSIDPELMGTVAASGVPYVLMHMKGDPQTMQQNPQYKNVTAEVFDALSFKVKQLTSAGISDIIIDPGFGFGKTIEHNFRLLRDLSFFTQLERPLLVGLSRKGTVYKTLQTTPEAALNGTTVVNTIALMNGAAILRVHDIKEAKEAILLYNACQNKKGQH